MWSASSTSLTFEKKKDMLRSQGPVLSLAEHPARRGRGDRLPPLPGRLPGGRGLCDALQDAVDEIAEATNDKRARLADMIEREAQGAPPESYRRSERWIGRLNVADAKE